MLLSGRTITTSTTGGYVHIIIPNGAALSGFDSFRITVSDFQSALQSQITTNTNNISGHETRITALENGSSKRLDSSVNAAYDFQQDANSEIEKIYIKNISGSPTIKIGTSVGGEEIQDEIGVVNEYKADLNFSDTYASANRTIYVTISGGTLDVVFYSVKSIFT